MTDSIDITTQQRKIILDLFKQYLPGVKVWAYGSRVKWTSKPESDLDIVVFPSPTQASQVSQLKEAFEESSLPFRVDTHIWDEVPEQFRKNIEKEHVELVGGISRGMGWTTIGSIAEVYDGPHATPKKIQSGPIFLGIGSLNQGSLDLTQSAHVSEEDFIQWTRRITPKVNDVVFSYETRLGEAAIIPQGLKCCLGRRMGLLRPDEKKIVPEFLLYAYLGPSFQSLIKARTIHGSTVDRIALKELPNFPIQVPPIEKQKETVQILKSLDDKIQLNRQINQTLEEMAQAIFKSWFVDFDPVKAKIDAKAKGEDPERAAMRVIAGKNDAEIDKMPAAKRKELASTAALFPDEMVESELGEIPKGWSWKTIAEWGDVICGKTPPKNDSTNYDGNIPFIKIPDMHGNVFITKTNDTLSQKGTETQKKKEIPKGSICISCIATVGLVCIASEYSHTNQQINSIVPSNFAHSAYLYFCLIGINSLLHDLASGGSATLNLNTGHFSKIPLLAPETKILLAFSKLTDSILEDILENDKQNQTLTQIRDSLLPKLLSGEIEVA
ncbi:MAG: restriction endonuclease subunit S [Leptospirales bacterium]